MKKKISGIQILRAVIQLAAFIAAPALFITVFSSIGEIFRAVIGSTFRIQESLGRTILAAAVFLITFIWGRFFCGFICSFGAMQDLLWAFGKHIPKRLTVPEKADRVLKYLKYLVLAFVVICIWTFAWLGDTVWSPWTIFGMYSSPFKGFAPATYLLSIGALLMLLIIIGSVFVERFFCKYFCPLGALFAIASRFRLFKIKKPSEGCGSCRACTKNCAMSIPLYKHDKVESGECIDCLKCLNACPRGNVKADALAAVSGTVAVTTVAGLYTVGVIPMTSVASNSQSVSATEEVETTEKQTISMGDFYNSFEENENTENTTETTETTEETTEAQSNGGFTDGTYTGTGTGFRGDTQVSVTVSGGKITDITITSYQDDYQFFSRAEQSVISDIISTQSTDVDAVSGATFSSRGIIEAVANALGIEYSNPNSSESGGHHSMHGF